MAAATTQFEDSAELLQALCPGSSELEFKLCRSTGKGVRSGGVGFRLPARKGESGVVLTAQMFTMENHSEHPAQREITSRLPGLESLQKESLGDSRICIAVIDGPVDLSHPCFEGADLKEVPTLVRDSSGTGRMKSHGTHVASIIFGQPHTNVPGIAPRCRGLLLPVFQDERQIPLSQLDLARAIEQAVQEGAHIINISGGQRSPKGQADPILERAVRLCEENAVLVVAAAGNDGCECLHVPAALRSVLAVGAMGSNGEPLESSNWGQAYQAKGILAPGESILGAVPGGGTAQSTGTSFATPIVSGVAALLLSIERQSGKKMDPLSIGAILLKSARPCSPCDNLECRRYLIGTLNITGAYTLMKGGKDTMADSENTKESADAGKIYAENVATATAEAGLVAAGLESGGTPTTAGPTLQADYAPVSSPAPSTVQGPPMSNCNCGVMATSYIFAVGNIGFDFGTEARRDSFRQLMPSMVVTRPDGSTVTLSPNPYDVNQLLDYLEGIPGDPTHPPHPWESTKLIWTLNLDLTPIYAIEAEIAYAEEVYKGLRSALRGQSKPDNDDNFVSRVSVSGVLTNRVVRLFWGQVVPLVKAQPRGLYNWNENQLIKSIVGAVVSTAVPAVPDTADRATRDAAEQRAAEYSEAAATALRNFLDKVYYQLRNLGQLSSDRALNYSATNAFAAAVGIAKAMNPASHGIVMPIAGKTSIYTLDSITTSKSPFCRMDSDCWDVQLTFFDPENNQRAMTVIQLTVDVSDEMPVSLAPIRFFTVAR